MAHHLSKGDITNKQMTINKTSEDQKIIHSRLIKSFALGFTTNSIEFLDTKLHDDGLFLNKYSKRRFLAYLYELFYDKKVGINELEVSYLNFGIALNKIPGAEVLEIRCTKKRYLRSKFGEMEDPFIGERVFRFCFQFKDDLIFAIEQPTRYTKYADKMMVAN